MTVVRLLAESERYAPRWPELLAALRAVGNTDLGSQLEPVLDTTWEELEADWRTFCEETWGGEGR